MNRVSQKLVSMVLACWVATAWMGASDADALPIPAAAAEDEIQARVANARRLSQAMDYLGSPLPEATRVELDQACRRLDGTALQRVLSSLVAFKIQLDAQGVATVQSIRDALSLQQAGYRPVVIHVRNPSGLKQRLRISSLQSGPVYSGPSRNILARQAQTDLDNQQAVGNSHERFLDCEIFNAQPMTKRLSGVAEEWVVALIYASQSGDRIARFHFSVEGQAGGIEHEVTCRIRPAVPVRMAIVDVDGQPSTARLEFRDLQGHIHPPQPKRLAPDFFFQPQIYRHHGEVVRLPPGRFTLIYSRGPEYRRVEQLVEVPKSGPFQIRVDLERWVDPMESGFFCGDHHIHAAGCSHYTSPTQGVEPSDMFRQVKGEGLNVGCVLTWGPCFEYQRQFFSPAADSISQPMTLLKYDLEISGFGSAALGHVCLLDLKDQTYPGSEGGKLSGWPTWTVPVMSWAKQQGGVTGYPHSAMPPDPDSGSRWLLARWDQNQNSRLEFDEASGALLPEPFDEMDRNADRRLSRQELAASIERVSHQLPNLALPAMNGAGAMEIFVSAALGVCDFVSAMDTARIPEWNTWYHLMNCGLPIKLSGETDFPCMSSRRVGQGRVYVQLGKDKDRVDFSEWCRGLAEGRSYVSDGFAHALKFQVERVRPGEGPVVLSRPGPVAIEAQVALAPEVPAGVAYGTQPFQVEQRIVGDTVQLHGPRSAQWIPGGKRRVELVVNGQVVQSWDVVADGKPHDLRCELEVRQSSWVALRQFPQLHTNPVQVRVADQPIRASRSSARWCLESIDVLWEKRQRMIAEDERPAARQAYDAARGVYRQIARESELRGN